MAQAKPKASPAPAKSAAAASAGSKPAAASAGGKAAPAAADIPDGVRAFLGTFSRRLRQRNLHELQTMYMVEFPRFSERFFARQPWPTAESIADLVDQDENFLVLYRELYFRHMYRFLTPTVEDRFDSWQNYIDLFNLLLGLKSDAPEFELPLIWQFDIIDEFVYQFQNYFAFRARKDLSEADLKFLRDDDNEHTWSAPTVLRYLHALVKKAGIRGAAASASTSGVAADEKKGKGDEKEPAAFFKALAQFAAIQLCRANCLLGDYTTALRVLDPIDLNSKRSAFSQVGGAYVTLYYYLSLAYLLSGRYTDAVKTASSLLMWAGRNSHDSSPTAVPRAHGKKVDQVYGLLALGTALNPQRLGESLLTSMRERFGDKLQRLQKMDVTAFEEVFLAAAPKFVDPAAPVGGYPSAPKAAADAKPKDAKDGKADAKEKKSAAAAADDDVATRTQVKRFSAEVKQRAPLPDTVSYLKLCTSITVSKLAAFCKIAGPDAAAVDNACAQQLMALKTKTRALRWRGGAPSAGLLTSNAEVDVAVNRDVVLVAEYKAARRYGEFLIRQILQLSRLADDINSIQTAAR